MAQPLCPSLPRTSLSRALLRLALGAAVVPAVSLSTGAAPALAVLPTAGSQPASGVEVTALEDRCGIRVALPTAPRDEQATVEAGTLAPSTPSERSLVLADGGRWTGDAAERTFDLDLSGVQAGDPQGQRVEVTVSVGQQTPEQTLLWLPRCVEASAGPSASPSASHGPASAPAPVRAPVRRLPRARRPQPLLRPRRDPPPARPS